MHAGGISSPTETQEANLPSVDSAMLTVEYARMAVGRNTNI